MLVAGIGLFAANVLGGGDGKLLAASAVWFGWAGLFKFVIYVAILGGVLALFILGLRRAGLRESWTGRPWIQRLRAPDRGIPYGIAHCRRRRPDVRPHCRHCRYHGAHAALSSNHAYPVNTHTHYM